jgi:hypothetical protein
MREGKVIALVTAAATFSSANAFVVGNEIGIVSEPIRSERQNDPILLFHEEVACGAPALLTKTPLAERTTESNSRKIIRITALSIVW